MKLAIEGNAMETDSVDNPEMKVEMKYKLMTSCSLFRVSDWTIASITYIPGLGDGTTDFMTLLIQLQSDSVSIRNFWINPEMSSEIRWNWLKSNVPKSGVSYMQTKRTV